MLNAQVLLDRLKLTIQIFIARTAVRRMPGKHQLHGHTPQGINCIRFCPHHHAV
jgi:hypothetical protein